MACDDDLVGIGLALVIVVGAMLVAVGGGFDGPVLAARLSELAAAVGAVVQAAVGALGI